MRYGWEKKDKKDKMKKGNEEIKNHRSRKEEAKR